MAKLSHGMAPSVNELMGGHARRKGNFQSIRRRRVAIDHVSVTGKIDVRGEAA